MKSAEGADEADILTEPTVRIRAYRPSDHPTLTAMWTACSQIPFTMAEVERLLDAKGEALVAEVLQPDGRHDVAGVVLWSNNGRSGFIWRLAVAPEHRRRGIATALLDRAENDIAAAGFASVGLLTAETRAAAKALYARRGWQFIRGMEYWNKRLRPPADIERDECEGD